MMVAHVQSAPPVSVTRTAQRTPLEIVTQIAQLDRSALSPLVRFAQSETDARRSLLEQYGITPPDGWERMPLADFLKLARTRRRPPSENPLQVRAYAYTNCEGKSIPVRSVRIHETDKYNNRSRFHNPARYGRFEQSFNHAELGRTYTVTVEWEDGRTQVSYVKNRGWPVEIW